MQKQFETQYGGRRGGHDSVLKMLKIMFLKIAKVRASVSLRCSLLVNCFFNSKVGEVH